MCKFALVPFERSPSENVYFVNYFYDGCSVLFYDFLFIRLAPILSPLVYLHQSIMYSDEREVNLHMCNGDEKTFMKCGKNTVNHDYNQPSVKLYG